MKEETLTVKTQIKLNQETSPGQAKGKLFPQGHKKRTDMDFWSVIVFRTQMVVTFMAVIQRKNILLRREF